MKTYNTKLAVIVFITLAMLDAVWYAVRHSLASEWLVAPWIAINLPGIPLFRCLAPFLPAGSWSMVGLLVTCVIFSAAFWSLLSGLVFRRKGAA